MWEVKALPNKPGLSQLDSAPPDPCRGEIVRVLLVEDSQVDALLMRRLLSRSCQVEQVTSLQAGLSHLRRAACDIVVLDLELPDVQGLDGLRRLHAAFPHMPVVVVTGASMDIGSEALELGAQDFVSKEQIDGDLLIRALRYAMTRKQSETLRQRLEHTDRLASLGQLAAGIAHEINNPLAFIMANLTLEREHFEAFAELCDALEVQAKTDSNIATMLEAADHKRRLSELDEILTDNYEGAERIRTIVRDLRSFARSETDQLTQVDLNETVMTACNITRNEVRHHARLLTSLSDLPPMLGDQARLCQVVVNLLVNAAQAIPEGQADNNEIEITTGVSGNGIVMRVRDTGSGIPEEQLSRIFEPFFTTKSRDAGTGLGLSLCAETIQRHGGSIDVASQIGQGTTIEVRLPVHQVANTPRPQPPKPRVPLGDGRVLLIDDEGSVRKAFSRMLRRDGYEVVEAENVVEALQLLEKAGDFDAIVCDLVMPDLDGADLYHALQRDYPNLCHRVVFISGGAFTTRTRDFVQQTKVHVIQKPPRAHALESAVRDITRKAG